MCPNCRAFITTKDRVCPYCDVQLGPRAIDVRTAQLGSFVPKANLTASVFLIINGAFFVAMMIQNYSLTKDPGFSGFSGTVLVLFGAKYVPMLRLDGWWRLVTAGFLHGSVLHILMNSWAMFDLVGEVEQFYGTSRLIVGYIASTVAGFWLSSVLVPQSLSVGASAAIFGLIGMMLAMGVGRSNPLAHSVRAYYGRWAVYGVIFSFIPGLHIDIAAHLGGLAGGFIIGLVCGMPGLPGTSREQIWKSVAILTVLLTAYCFYKDAVAYQALIKSM